MVLTHVESDQDILHFSYYETDLHKEGILELTLVDPADRRKIHDDDICDVEDPIACCPGQPVTLVIHHPDGTEDTCSAKYL